MRIGLVSALFILLYFIFIGWAVYLCERELDRLLGTHLVEFPSYQYKLPSTGRTD